MDVYGRIGARMQSGLGGWRGLMPTCMLGRKEHKVRFVCLFMHAMGEWWMFTCIRMHMGWRVCVWRDGSGLYWLGLEGGSSGKRTAEGLCMKCAK